MMKLMLALILISAATVPVNEKTPVDHYVLHATRADTDDSLPSCGATPRFLREEWDVLINRDTGTVKVNATYWVLEEGYDRDGDFIIWYSPDANAFTKMSMLIEPHGDNKATGVLTLTSITDARKPCFDRVYLKGKRD